VADNHITYTATSLGRIIKRSRCATFIGRRALKSLLSPWPPAPAYNIYTYILFFYRMDVLQRRSYYNNISIGIEPVFVVGFKRCNMCVYAFYFIIILRSSSSSVCNTLYYYYGYILLLKSPREQNIDCATCSHTCNNIIIICDILLYYVWV